MGAFLRSRRRRLAPGDLGLPDGLGRRRTAGLRREEVAAAAAISVDYYTRLEQGRRTASDSVLAALSRALRLTAVERRYLVDLARDPVRAWEHEDDELPALRPGLRTLLDGVRHTPVLALGPGMQVLAWNSLLCAVMIDFANLPADERNLVWLTFMNEELQSRYVDLDATKDATLGYLRRDRALHPQRRELSDPMIARLSAVSPVSPPMGGAPRRHPRPGAGVAPRPQLRRPRTGLGELHL